MKTEPSHAYYRAMEGQWRCDYDLVITDWTAFWASRVSWFDRMRILSLVAVGKVLGPPRLETSVDYGADGERGEVVHTTRLVKWGLTLFRSVEIMLLHDDGRHATMRGDKWEGLVEVDENADGADYTFDWFGTPMRQVTRVEPLGLRIDQDSAWSHGVQLLRRV